MTSHIPDDVQERVSALVSVMNEMEAQNITSEICFFVFHVPVPAGSSEVYVDAQKAFNQESVDYLSVLDHFFAMANANHKRCQIYFITDLDLTINNLPDFVIPIRFNFDSNFPMFERVIAMNAFVRSRMFKNNSVFLDADAFVNMPLNRIFNHKFDIGLTYRNIDIIMPINEGVIFAAPHDRVSVTQFFDRYLGTYVNLDRSANLEGIFGAEFSNIKRWRGGQLSLNASLRDKGNYCEHSIYQEGSIRIQMLNCDTYNFWIRGGMPYTFNILQKKYILHLKGSAKSNLNLFQSVKKAQAQIHNILSKT